MKQYSLAALNEMSKNAFVEALGDIFEKTPSIAAKTWEKRPFSRAEALFEAMVEVMYSLSEAEQLQLMRSHPDLGSKVKMAEASVQEQASVGLNALSTEEYQQFHQLNTAYRDKFGFPFIIAVKNHNKTSILEAFSQRLNHTLDEEKNTALNEIAQIARFRLYNCITVVEWVSR